MQKFTLFSILLSLIVVLFIGDLVLTESTSVETEPSEAVELQSETFSDVVPAAEANESESLVAGLEETGPETVEAAETPLETVELDAYDVEEDFDLALLISNLSPELLVQAGFQEPVLDEVIFTGSLFEFVRFSDQVEAFIRKYNVFSGENFVGSFYEARYPSSTDAFNAYLKFRDRTAELSDIGSVNETNTYGKSFYFNHNERLKTVFMGMVIEDTVYAFEYAYAYHDLMKALYVLLD